LIVVKVSKDDPTIYKELLGESIKGESVKFDDENLEAISNPEEIRKVYKLQQPHKNRPKHDVNVSREAEATVQESRHDLELSILGMIALRGAT
jgi:hypothetical protein